jgi:hypothetical protein
MGGQLSERSWKDVEWIDLAQDGDKRRVLVNRAINLIFLKNVGNFVTSGGTVVF